MYEPTAVQARAELQLIRQSVASLAGLAYAGSGAGWIVSFHPFQCASSRLLPEGAFRFPDSSHEFAAEHATPSKSWPWNPRALDQPTAAFATAGATDTNPANAITTITARRTADHQPRSRRPPERQHLVLRPWEHTTDEPKVSASARRGDPASTHPPCISGSFVPLLPLTAADVPPPPPAIILYGSMVVGA
jgi:hypothetical protein